MRNGDEDYIFKDNNSVFVEIVLEDNSTKKIRVNKFGWLQNYLFKSVNQSNFKSEQISNDIIGNEIFAVFNEKGEIECFGDDMNSERMKDILNL
jgi:hypothetical protein